MDRMNKSAAIFNSRKRRRIAILGGSGFVGSHLVARLSQEDHRIKVLARRREDHRELLVHPTADVISVDSSSGESLLRAFENVDVVINLVGILNEKGHSGRGFREAHVNLTQRAADAAAKAGVKRFLQMSALGAGPEGPSHYQRTKGEAESFLMTHAARHMAVTIFKPSLIFGAGTCFVDRFAGLLKMAPVMPLACPDARFAPVYVGDVVEAMVRSIDDPGTYGKRYELCGPETWTLREIVHYLRQQLGLKRLVLPLPKPLGKLQAMVFEFLPGKPFSVDNFNSLQLDNVCSEDGFAEFGIQPTSMDAVVPYLLRPLHPRRRYDRFRSAYRPPQRG